MSTALADVQQVRPTESELIEDLGSISESQRLILRKKALRNLFFMTKGILRRKDLVKRVHDPLCKFLVRAEDEPGAYMTLMARGWFKSTISTEGNSVRLACRDPDEFRGLIIGSTIKKAQDFISVIDAHFRGNQYLRLLFPEVIPDKFAGPGIQWSSEGLRLNRTTAYKEATFTPMGVGGSAVGLHFTHLFPDDIVDLEGDLSEAVLKFACRWLDQMESLGNGEQNTWIYFSGTRWSIQDVYRYAMSLYGVKEFNTLTGFLPERNDVQLEADGRMRVFHRSCRLPNGESGFPERFSTAYYNRLQRKTPEVYYSQQENDPIASANRDFQGGARRYKFHASEQAVVLHAEGRIIVHKVEKLDRVLVVDPNSGSATAPDDAAIYVGGRSHDDYEFALHSEGRKFSPDALVDRTFDLAVRWRPRVIGIEEAGQQNTLFYFRKKMRKEKIFFHVVPLKPDNDKSKPERIRKLMNPLIENGEFCTRDSQTSLNRQVDFFPDVKPIDELDAAAWAQKLHMTPQAERDEAVAEDKVRKLLLLRHPVTGY